MEELEDLINELYVVNDSPSCLSRGKIRPKLGKKFEEFSDVSSSYVLWSFCDMSRAKKDAYIMSLFNSIFSEGMSSRLVRKIREELGLVYTISSDIQMYSNRGVGGIFTICDRKNIDRIEEEMFNILDDLKKGNFSDKELEKAKNLHEVAIIQKSMSGKVNVAVKNVGAYLRFGRLSNDMRHYKMLQSITKDDLIEFANKKFNKELFSRTVLSPKTNKEKSN